MEPAATIILSLGGSSAVASIVGVHRSRVWNWTRPKEKGGTGGIIPFRHAPILIQAAQELGLALNADDFLPRCAVDECDGGSQIEGRLNIVASRELLTSADTGVQLQSPLSCTPVLETAEPVNDRL